jgi:hypothetical protein
METISLSGLDKQLAQRLLGNRQLMSIQDVLMLNRMFECPAVRSESHGTVVDNVSHFVPVTTNPEISQVALVNCLMSVLIPPKVALVTEAGAGGSLAKNSKKKKLILALSLTGFFVLLIVAGYFSSVRVRKLLDPADAADAPLLEDDETEPAEVTPALPSAEALEQTV